MKEVIEESTLQSENISEKKSFWQNSKIPIVVALVAVGLTILVIGWWIWNSQLLVGILVSKSCQEDSDCTFTQCCGCATKCRKICSEKPFALPCECKNNQCVVKQTQQVAITTDETEYEQGETVKIIVKNNSEEAVYLDSCNPYYPEIEKNGAWGRTFLKECETFSIKDEISPEESKILQECETGSREGPLLPWKFYPGNWRITLEYYLGCVDEEPSRCLSHKTIYSNEFRIKEKESGEECYQDPREALDNFLSYLHNGQYEKAAKIYGGDYKLLESYNEDVDPQNRPKLLERWCTVNGGECLRHEILSGKAIPDDGYEFTVQFFNEDGSIFDIPPVVPEARKAWKEIPFFYKVVRVNNCYKVMDLPPYTP